MKKPFFGVILATNKFDDYFHVAVNSILNQDFTDYKIILVVNGDHESIEKFLFYENQRLKVMFVQLERLSFALDLAAVSLECEYLVRMDADDVSHPDRLSKMHQFLLEKGFPDVVGSWVRCIDSKNNFLKIGKSEIENEKIRNLLPFKNPFWHPSVVLNRKIFLENKGYANGLKSEDYDLWVRMAKNQKIIFMNLPVVCLDYRVDSGTSFGSKLSYAEVSAIRLREFLLLPSLINFWSIFYWLFKFIFLSKRS